MEALREEYRLLGGPPSEKNWIEDGIVTWPRNQGHCGSCATFAATAVIESCFISVRNYNISKFNEVKIFEVLKVGIILNYLTMYLVRIYNVDSTFYNYPLSHSTTTSILCRKQKSQYI